MVRLACAEPGPGAREFWESPSSALEAPVVPQQHQAAQEDQPAEEAPQIRAGLDLAPQRALGAEEEIQETPENTGNQGETKCCFFSFFIFFLVETNEKPRGVVFGETKGKWLGFPRRQLQAGCFSQGPMRNQCEINGKR